MIEKLSPEPESTPSPEAKEALRDRREKWSLHLSPGGEQSPEKANVQTSEGLAVVGDKLDAKQSEAAAILQHTDMCPPREAVEMVRLALDEAPEGVEAISKVFVSEKGTPYVVCRAREGSDEVSFRTVRQVPNSEKIAAQHLDSNEEGVAVAPLHEGEAIWIEKGEAISALKVDQAESAPESVDDVKESIRRREYILAKLQKEAAQKKTEEQEKKKRINKLNPYYWGVRHAELKDKISKMDKKSTFLGGIAVGVASALAYQYFGESLVDNASMDFSSLQTPEGDLSDLGEIEFEGADVEDVYDEGVITREDGSTVDLEAVAEHDPDMLERVANDHNVNNAELDQLAAIQADALEEGASARTEYQGRLINAHPEDFEGGVVDFDSVSEVYGSFTLNGAEDLSIKQDGYVLYFSPSENEQSSINTAFVQEFAGEEWQNIAGDENLNRDNLLELSQVEQGKLEENRETILGAFGIHFEGDSEAWRNVQSELEPYLQNLEQGEDGSVQIKDGVDRDQIASELREQLASKGIDVQLTPELAAAQQQELTEEILSDIEVDPSALEMKAGEGPHAFFARLGIPQDLWSQLSDNSDLHERLAPHGDVATVRDMGLGESTSQWGLNNDHFSEASTLELFKEVERLQPGTLENMGVPTETVEQLKDLDVQTVETGALGAEAQPVTVETVNDLYTAELHVEPGEGPWHLFQDMHIAETGTNGENVYRELRFDERLSSTLSEAGFTYTADDGGIGLMETGEVDPHVQEIIIESAAEHGGVDLEGEAAEFLQEQHEHYDTLTQRLNEHLANEGHGDVTINADLLRLASNNIMLDGDLNEYFKLSDDGRTLELQREIDDIPADVLADKIQSNQLKLRMS